MKAGTVPGAYIRDLYSRARRNVFIPCPKGLFAVDDWGRKFAEELQDNADAGMYANGKLIECGVGTGANLVGLGLHPEGPALIGGCDVIPLAVQSTGSVLQANQMRKRTYTLKTSSLFAKLTAQELDGTTDVIACIPQAEPDPDADLSDPQTAANYCGALQSAFRERGLALLDKLFEQMEDKTPEAAFTGIFALRPGEDSIRDLLEHHGRHGVVSTATRTEQSGLTGLGFFADMEEQQPNRPFVFWTKEGKRINGRQAFAAVKEKKKVYHDLVVVHSPASRPSLSMI